MRAANHCEVHLRAGFAVSSCASKGGPAAAVATPLDGDTTREGVGDDRYRQNQIKITNTTGSSGRHTVFPKMLERREAYYVVEPSMLKLPS